MSIFKLGNNFELLYSEKEDRETNICEVLKTFKSNFKAWVSYYDELGVCDRLKDRILDSKFFFSMHALSI